MIVDLIDKLIDRCIGLVKAHNESKRSLLTDFLDPTYAAFEAIHKEYLADFRRYRTRLKSNESFSKTVNFLRDTLHEDNLFTADQRTKLLQLSRLHEDNLFGDLVVAIEGYLLKPTEELYEPERGQMWRTSLSHVLDQILRSSRTEADKRLRALGNLDILVNAMQKASSKVTAVYLKAKQSLLS